MIKIKIAAWLFLSICLSAVAQTVEPFGPKANASTANAGALPPLTISLKGDWHFAPDPSDQGSKEKWYADNFSDSTWKTLTTGKAWQLQGVDLNGGWGWFRQKISVPKEYAGVPMILQLRDNESDDEVWVNGTYVGGNHGKYEYKNIKKRLYVVPASILHYGELNTIAIRVWGGVLGFDGAASEGLVAGDFSATLDPYYVSMRKPGGTEQPGQLFDLSDAQQGKPFEIIFRFLIFPKLAKY